MWEADRLEGFSHVRAIDEASPRLHLIAPKLRLFAGVLVTIAFAVLIAWSLTGLPFVSDYSRGLQYGLAPDIWHERVTAWEAIWGDPYRSLAVMMPEHGYPGFDGVSPRTPAALLLQLPLLLIPESALMPVVTTLILLGALATIGLAAHISGVELARLVWVGPFLVLSFPVVTAVSYGSLNSLVMVTLLLLSWANRDKSWAGIPLGVAMASRLWPGLVVVGFWISGRRRAAFQAFAIFIVMNLAGLALPGVGLTGTIRVLLGGGPDWVEHTQNASVSYLLLQLGVPVAISVMTASGFALFMALRDPEKAIPICVIGGLIASPLSWPAYSLAALPVAALAWRNSPPRWRALIGMAILPSVAWLETPTAWKGYLGFATLALLFIAVVRSAKPQRGVIAVLARHEVDASTHMRAPVPLALD